MRILVTGGTGFVGSHTVAALMRSGHSVRLLARSRDRIEPALDLHGCTPSEVVIGDVTDPPSVRAALTGCEAVIHAANIFSFDRRLCADMHRVNETGTNLVLTEATRLELDPIVHVSSYVSLLPSDKILTEDSEVGVPTPDYCRSKAVAECVARRFQSEGFPVVTTYPGSVWGPHDPYLGESNRLAVSALKGRLRFLNKGPLPISDVRDVATAHAALLQPGLGPRRYVVVGHNPDIRTLVTQLGDVVGRHLWSIPVPAPMAYAAGHASDWVKARFGLDTGLSFTGPWLFANGAQADSSLAINELGIAFNSLETTLADTVRWLLATGNISSRHAGSLAA